MDSSEKLVPVGAIRVAQLRHNYGTLKALADDIRANGLRLPVTAWQDGTLISGGRRLRAHLLIGAQAIPTVFVHTIEDATKALQRDNEDTHLALPWKWSEVCRLWDLLRRLDEPAARLRADANRRKGVERRRQTIAGIRQPGRHYGRGVSADYALNLMAVPFGISPATARRLRAVHAVAAGQVEATEERRELAREIMRDIDENGNIWANFQRLTGTRPAPRAARQAATREPASPARQRAAWDKALPQMEGLLAGLVELGPVNPALTWDEVGPVHARLVTVRRELEKIVKQMKENASS